MNRAEMCLEEACNIEENENLEQFDEQAFFEKEKEFFKKSFEREELHKKKRELTKKAREEVLKELGKEEEDDECCIQTSEVSEKDYKQLVKDIKRLVARNTEIIATFIDKKAIKDASQNGLSGLMIKEYLNNEETLHTYLDRIQSININICIGKNFWNSTFGSVKH